MAGIVFRRGVARFAAEDTRLECEKARDCAGQSSPSEAEKDAAFAAASGVVIHATQHLQKNPNSIGRSLSCKIIKFRREN